MLEGGRVMLPSLNGPTPARTPEGQLYDILDVSDQLADRFGRIYVRDLDGLVHDQPQLDYLQEIARGAEVWVDAGVRTGEQAIDIVVAGAFRTVISSRTLEHPAELEQAWKLTPEIAFEIEVESGRTVTRAKEWAGRSPGELADTARALGIVDVIYSPAAPPIDWSTVKALAASGPLWVAGAFETEQLPQLRDAGATGGIFHIAQELEGEVLTPTGGSR